jgi:hypothetical protein
MTEQKKRVELSWNANYTISTKCTIYINHPKKTLWGFCKKPRGTVRIESTQIGWFLGQLDGRLDLVRDRQGTQN